MAIKTKIWTTTLPPDLIERIQNYSKKTNIRQNMMIQEAMELYFEKHKEVEPRVTIQVPQSMFLWLAKNHPAQIKAIKPPPPKDQ